MDPGCDPDELLWLVVYEAASAFSSKEGEAGVVGFKEEVDMLLCFASATAFSNSGGVLDATDGVSDLTIVFWFARRRRSA